MTEPATKKRKLSKLETAAAAARLDEAQAKQIRLHVKLLGLKAIVAHADHVNYFVKEFGRPVEVIQSFIRAAAKDSAQVTGTIHLNDHSNGHGSSEAFGDELDSENSAVGVDNNGNSNNGNNTAGYQSPIIASMKAKLSELLSQVDALGDIRDHTTIANAANDHSLENDGILSENVSVPNVVLKKAVFGRKKPTASVYSRYQDWAKVEMQTFNRNGLASGVQFKPLNFTQWETKQKSATGQTLYLQILEKKTPAHVALCAQWEKEAAEAKHVPQIATLSVSELARARNQEIKLFKRVSKSLAAKGVELQGCLFNVQNGLTEDVSTGETGKRVSKKLYKEPVSRPPTVFRTVLFKRDQTLAKRFNYKSTDRSLEAVRCQVRNLLLAKQNAALKGFKQEPSGKFQIKKLLSEKGYKGIIMEGYPFLDSKTYSQLTLAQCQTVKARLKNIKFKQVEELESDFDDDDTQNSSVSGDSDCNNDGHCNDGDDGDGDANGDGRCGGRDGCGGGDVDSNGNETVMAGEVEVDTCTSQFEGDGASFEGNNLNVESMLNVPDLEPPQQMASHYEEGTMLSLLLDAMSGTGM
ncbi:hypothetical protein BDR26DRAFT_879560 [Obelidium mucronatum]|nr:hypothetical protein BDR26DRAFT_879560 [Obelidium mucronatum]